MSLGEVSEVSELNMTKSAFCDEVKVAGPIKGCLDLVDKLCESTSDSVAYVIVTI